MPLRSAAAHQWRLRPGDRILLLVQGDTVLSDTFTVVGDRMLPLPSIPPIHFRACWTRNWSHTDEGAATLHQRGRVTATPLVRIRYSGSHSRTSTPSGRPGDYGRHFGCWWLGFLPASPTTRRLCAAGSSLMDAKATAEAVRLAKTVGDMALRDGDELYVPDRASSTFNWQAALGTVSALTRRLFPVALWSATPLTPRCPPIPCRGDCDRA